MQTAVGTGVVIDASGHILTNAYLVFEASDVTNSPGDDEMYPASVVGFDAITDLGVIKFDAAQLRLPQATLGSSPSLAIGEEVMAIGFPYGIGKTATVTLPERPMLASDVRRFRGRRSVR